MGERVVQCGLAVAAGLLWAVCVDGPDFGRYLEWGYASFFHDIFELRGEVLSRTGVPFSVASIGPGLLFATVYKALGTLVAFRTTAYWTGWLAAMLFWSCALIVLNTVAGGGRRVALFGAGALFIATPVGFYSHAHSTEVFASAFVAAIWALALARRKAGLLECAAAGCIAGLLLLVRPYLVLYAAPSLYLVVVGSHERRNWRALAVRLTLSAVPVSAAILQSAIVNRWMSGSPWQPAYVFGGFGFSSVDLAHPQIAAVLAHPFHGLLAYHPLYGIGGAALVVAACRPDPLRVLYAGTLVALLAHVWVQSAWFVWWLGGGSFGMRGMAPAALPLTVALVAVIHRTRVHSPRLALAWIRVTAVACVWSFSLLLQRSTQFMTWRELLGAQRWALAAVGALTAVWLFHALARRAAATQAVADTEVRAGGLMLLALSLGYLADLAGSSMRTWSVAVAVAGATALVAWLARRLPARVMQGAPVLLVATALLVFAVQGGLFAQLAVRTERRLAAGEPPPRDFRYVSVAPVDDLRQTYREYREIPGFDRPKRSLGAFLNWLHLDAAGMAAADRQLAEDVLTMLAGDPIAGELQVQITAKNGVVRLTAEETSAAQRARAATLAGEVPGVSRVDDQME